MELKEELQQIVDHYLYEIEHVNTFVSSVEKSLERKRRRKPKKLFSEVEAKQLREIGEYIQSLAKNPALEGKSFDVSDNVSNYLLQVSLPMTYSSALAAMSVAYLVSFQEAFLKDYVQALLRKKRNMLRSMATLTYERILEFDSIDEIVTEMAEREVNAEFGYGGIDDVKNYFSKKMNINLDKFSNWESLREINYRRNAIIHNGGIADDVYCIKTNNKDAKAAKIHTDHDYVRNSVQTLKLFIEYLHKECFAKHKFEAAD